MGQLEVVRELVVAGADPVAVGRRGETPLTMAHDCVHVLAFLMQFPAVRASIDHESQSMTALGWASTIGDDPDCVELLLGAGANPTIPGRRPLEEEARLFSNQGAFNVLRAAIPEPGRARALHKVCSIREIPLILRTTRACLAAKGVPALVEHRILAFAVPACVASREDHNEALPRVELTPYTRPETEWPPILWQELDEFGPNEEREMEEYGYHLWRATLAFVLGLADDGVEYPGLPWEVSEQLLEYILPKWVRE